MSVSFYGKGPNGCVGVEDDDPTMNLANTNAAAFLGLLELPTDELCGEVELAQVRRAVIKARATFGRKADAFTRESTDTKQPGRARIISMGLDRDQLKDYLDRFERLLTEFTARGCTEVYWG
jgi:hypothetical protein